MSGSSPREECDVRFGPRIHGLEPDGPEPDIAMSGSSPSAAGMSGLGPQLLNNLRVQVFWQEHTFVTSFVTTFVTSEESKVYMYM